LFRKRYNPKLFLERDYKQNGTVKGIVV